MDVRHIENALPV